jgi:putative ABC transport system permease protein
MGGLTALAWRSLAARRLRSLLTVVGIALGVGVLVASLAVDAGIERSIDRTVEDLVGRADVRISSFRETGLSDETVEAIRATPGVAVAAPAVERRTYLEQGASDRTAVTVLGIDPLLHPEVHDLAVVSGGALSRRDEPAVLISERLAREDGFGLGSELLLGALEHERFRIVGLVEGDGPLVGAFGRVAIIPIDAAMRIFGVSGVDRVDVRLDPTADAEAVEADLAARLITDPYVLASPRDLAGSLRASTADFRGTTALIAGVALFVGAFLIFNTLSMTVGERVREVGLLRAAGATRGQVTGFVLAGAAVLGVLGAALGLIVGIALAAGTGRWVTTVASVRVDRVDVDLPGLALAAVIGLIVTVAAALEPAWRAGRIAPVEALRLRAEPARGQAARLRWLVAVFAAIGVVALLIWPRGAGENLAVRSLVVYGVLLVATVLSPFLLAPLGRLAGAPFGWLGRIEERLARASLIRDRSRTALTVGALTIGLAMIVAVGGVAQNARRAAGAWIESVVPGDTVLTAIRPIPLGGSTIDVLRTAPGVTGISPVATFDLAFRGSRLDAAAVVGADFLDDGRLTFAAGDRGAALGALDAGGAAVLPAALAGRLDLGVGDTMTVPVGGGADVTLTVAGIAERTLPGGGGESVLVGWRDAEAFGVEGVDFFAVRFGADATQAQRAALAGIAAGDGLEVNSLDRVQQAVSDALDRVFGLFDALAIVAVIVAALGIVNTLTMNVLERVRELGVLRATGMTRRQIGRMVVVEAGIVGLIGAVLGTVTGLVAGGVMLAFAAGSLDLAVEVPWLPIGVCFLLGIGVSMAAAWYPARLAGRLSIVRAVQYE